MHLWDSRLRLYFRSFALILNSLSHLFIDDQNSSRLNLHIEISVKIAIMNTVASMVVPIGSAGLGLKVIGELSPPM